MLFVPFTFSHGPVNSPFAGCLRALRYSITPDLSLTPSVLQQGVVATEGVDLQKCYSQVSKERLLQWGGSLQVLPIYQ